MARFWAVWLVSLLLEVSGVIAASFTVVACILVIQFRDQVDPAGVPLDEFSLIVRALVGVGIRQILIVGLASSLGLFFVGQLLAVLLSMEKHSRTTSELLSIELYKLVMEEVRRREQEQ